MIPGQGVGGHQLVDQLEPGGRTLGHGNGHRPVQRHHGRRRQLHELSIEKGDLPPVGVFRHDRGGVARGDGGLHLVGPRAALAQSGVQQPASLDDASVVPARSVLVLERDQVTRAVNPSRPPGVMEEHERENPERLGFVRHELTQQTAQPHGLVAKITPDHSRPARGAVSLVEQQVQHPEYTHRPLREELARRHPIGNPGIPDLVFGPHQPFGHGLLRHQEGAGDLDGGQARKRSQGQGDLGIERQRRMTTGEDQAQSIVGDAALVVLDRIFGPRPHRDLPVFH